MRISQCSVVFRIALIAWALAGCSADAEIYDPDPAKGDDSNGSTTDVGDGEVLDMASDLGSKSDVSESAPDGGDDGPGAACGCPVGDGPYCGRRAMDFAANDGCTLDPMVTEPDVLYGCEGGAWTQLEACADTCAYDETSTDLDDECVLPVCECFVQVAYCGSGAAKVAREMGCRIPLLPEHRGDILYCPGGEWSVREACDDGCIEAPAGTPDLCKTESDYLLPVPCPTPARCTNGNDTGTHTGKDHYAYDFGMPIGEDVVAMRGGTVHRVRNVSGPGDPCYTGGSTSCANYANTVEIKHSDGTIGLYMHLQRGTVQAGELIRQGEKVGVSGNSGWSTGPHLHVQVQQDCGSWWCQSIPFRFGERANITRGTTVASSNCPPE